MIQQSNIILHLRNTRVHRILLLFFFLLMISCSSISFFNKNELTQIPEGFKIVKSTHGLFQYLIPQDMEKEASNSYKNNQGSIYEQIYPSHEITEEYCNSFNSIQLNNNITETKVENRVYNNGNITGCLNKKIIENTSMNIIWKRTGFLFPSKSGIEDIEIQFKSEYYDEELVMIIINSIKFT